MPSIESITIEATDTAAAEVFYEKAFGLGGRLRVRESDSPTTGFRGFTLSLVVVQPADVDAFVGAAGDAGATIRKPAEKSFWGYGGALAAPDGTIWTVASSSKKNSGPASKAVEEFVLLLGTTDMAATKRFYVEHGFEVGRSFGRKYTEFAGQSGGIKLALNSRKALAKNAGVAPEGTGSHRIVIGGAGAFTDPDGFVWA